MHEDHPSDPYPMAVLVEFNLQVPLGSPCSTHSSYSHVVCTQSKYNCSFLKYRGISDWSLHLCDNFMLTLKYWLLMLHKILHLVGSLQQHVSWCKFPLLLIWSPASSRSCVNFSSSLPASQMPSLMMFSSPWRTWGLWTPPIRWLILQMARQNCPERTTRMPKFPWWKVSVMVLLNTSLIDLESFCCNIPDFPGRGLSNRMQRYEVISD